jgi:hypothetical protein
MLCLSVRQIGTCNLYAGGRPEIARGLHHASRCDCNCRIVLDDIVRLGWHVHTLEGWVAAVRLAALSSPSGGSPYCTAIAAGLTGGRGPFHGVRLADPMTAPGTQGYSVHKPGV